MKKIKRPKPVSYTVIPQTSDIGIAMYEQLYAIIDAHHEDLSRTNVRVVLAWCTSWKADVDGRITLGKCKKASELDRELAPFDFVILLSRDFWQNPRVTDQQRAALLDHELMHAAVTYDERGDAKVDERGRTCYRIRKHDLEEFRDVVARHGCYKNDIEAFAQALTRAERQTSTAWVGFNAVREQLKAIGVDVPTSLIAMWPESERRDVMTWALLRQEAGVQSVNVALASSMPACLASALNESAAVSH